MNLIEYLSIINESKLFKFSKLLHSRPSYPDEIIVLSPEESTKIEHVGVNDSLIIKPSKFMLFSFR